MKPKTKSELMTEWANQPDQLKREREVKAVRKAMDDARAVIRDGLTRYIKKKTKARSMAKAENDPFAGLAVSMPTCSLSTTGNAGKLKSSASSWQWKG